MKIFVTTMLALFLFVVPAVEGFADEIGPAQLEQAQAFIDQMGQDGIGFLSNSDLDEVKRKREFEKLLNRSFDMGTIGRFAMGRNWKIATKAERTEYQKLFKRMIIDVYSQRFSDYNGQKLTVTKARPEGKYDILVHSMIVPPNGEKIRVDWRVRPRKGKYKVVDVIVEGVSMALTQRADFSSIIQRGGGDVSVLLAHLEK